MPEWPRTIPYDLKKDMEELESWRSAPGNQDRWSVILEWLERHDVAAPKTLPVEPEME